MKVLKIIAFIVLFLIALRLIFIVGWLLKMAILIIVIGIAIWLIKEFFGEEEKD